MAFKWIYWNLLLRGHPIPFIEHKMQTEGKQIPEGLDVAVAST
jgi:sulfide:quinone oxidoreductase